jgi:hypothetical protein
MNQNAVVFVVSVELAQFNKSNFYMTDFLVILNNCFIVLTGIKSLIFQPNNFFFAP